MGEQPGQLRRSPWPGMLTVMAGMVMISLDTTIVTVALHPIGVDLHAGSSGVEWVVSIYLLALVASQPLTGWVSDRYGRKQTFLASLAVFTLASLACAASPNLGFLIGFRAIQGLGGGALTPVGMAIALELFPRERHGYAMGMWGLAALCGPAFGPTLGGWLATSVSWHWLFLINVPIGVLAFISGLFVLSREGHRERRPFDVTGLLLGSSGLSLLVLGLSEGNNWGWASPATIACLVVGIGALVAFVPHELGTEQPMLQLRIFHGRAFRLSCLAMLMILIVQFGRLVFIPLELESVRNISALDVGLLFLPAAATQAIGMQIGGQLVDRVGPRIPMVSGTSVLWVAVCCYALLSRSTPIALIATFLAIQGVGAGVIVAPGTVAGLSELPANLRAQGTAVRSLVNQIGGALSVGLLGAIVAIAKGRHPSLHQQQVAYDITFACSGGIALVALFLSVRFPGRERLRLAADEAATSPLPAPEV